MRIGAIVQILCLLGLVLSLYAIYVEHKKNADPSYSALCDYGGIFSCSKVFTSKYGSLGTMLMGEDSFFAKPNAFFGAIFYTGVFVLQIGFLPFRSLRRTLSLAAASSSCMLSIYLGYILAVVLKDFCIVCVSTYFINTIILILLLRKPKSTAASVSQKKQK